MFQLSPLSQLPSLHQKNRHYIYENVVWLLALSLKDNTAQSFKHQCHGVLIITLPVLHLMSTWWRSRANEAPWPQKLRHVSRGHSSEKSKSKLQNATQRAAACIVHRQHKFNVQTKFLQPLLLREETTGPPRCIMVLQLLLPMKLRLFSKNKHYYFNAVNVLGPILNCFTGCHGLLISCFIL